jgi:hypothetical protein
MQGNMNARSARMVTPRKIVVVGLFVASKGAADLLAQSCGSRVVEAVAMGRPAGDLVPFARGHFGLIFLCLLAFPLPEWQAGVMRHASRVKTCLHSVQQQMLPSRLGVLARSARAFRIADKVQVLRTTHVSVASVLHRPVAANTSNIARTALPHPLVASIAFAAGAAAMSSSIAARCMDVNDVDDVDIDTNRRTERVTYGNVNVVSCRDICLCFLIEMSMSCRDICLRN